MQQHAESQSTPGIKKPKGMQESKELQEFHAKELSWLNRDPNIGKQLASCFKR